MPLLYTPACAHYHLLGPRALWRASLHGTEHHQRTCKTRGRVKPEAGSRRFFLQGIWPVLTFSSLVRLGWLGQAMSNPNWPSASSPLFIFIFYIHCVFLSHAGGYCETNLAYCSSPLVLLFQYAPSQLWPPAPTQHSRTDALPLHSLPSLSTRTTAQLGPSLSLLPWQKGVNS